MYVKWQPPPPGVLKLNFDAAYKDGCTVTAAVLRNNSGTILGAWVNRFHSENSFCSEVEAAVQALKIAADLKINTACFEGDAHNVILVMNGFTQFQDWRAKSVLEEGKRILSGRLFWTLSYTPRVCNALAHKIAKWASPLHFCGKVVMSLLPPDFWQKE